MITFDGGGQADKGDEGPAFGAGCAMPGSALAHASSPSSNRISDDAVRAAAEDAHEAGVGAPSGTGFNA